MEPRRTLPDAAEYRAQVVAWYLSSGKTIAEVAASLNLPESTVREWVWYTSLDAISDQSPDLASSGPEKPAKATTRAEKRAVAEALARAEAAAEAEASARSEAAAAREETRAAYAAAVEAIVRAELKAAEAVAEAEASAHMAAQAAAGEEIAAVYAAAVEAMIRTELAASEKVAQAEAAAGQAVAEAKALAQSEVVSRLAAESAAREEVAAAYATALDAVARTETPATEALALGQALPIGAVAPPKPPATIEMREVASLTKALRVSAPSDRSAAETAARAEIAQLVSGFAPVELWVHTTGRTLAEARDAALEQLGVAEGQAEIEILSNRSRWLPGRIQIRARVRADAAARS